MFFIFKYIKKLFKKEEVVVIQKIKTALEYMNERDTSEEYFSGSYGISDHTRSEGKIHREID